MAVSAPVVTSGGGTTTTVNDLYQLGHLAEQTDGAGTMLASFSYDAAGVPTSVQVGSDPATAPRYYYVYNGHGDMVALTDASGTSVATYGYDAWGAVTVDTEHFANGWRNPYLYDGRDGARYDTETGLYWLSVRAYDPTLGRFLSHDPLGRAPLCFADQPYAYAGNNPLTRVDPTGLASWPAHTVWTWTGKHLRAYLTNIEEHGDGVWHYNLHVQSKDGKHDYHNYHISFGGKSCCDWTWRIWDGGTSPAVPPERFLSANMWNPIGDSALWLAAAEAININGDLGHMADNGLLVALMNPLGPLDKALQGTARKAGINVLLPYPCF